MSSSEIETAKPESFSGKASSIGYNFDAKSIFGGGFSISAFESGLWKGLSVGLNIGIGKGVTLGAATRGDSQSIMLSNEKPTKERSTMDRVINKAGFTPMVTQALYQYITKQK